MFSYHQMNTRAAAASVIAASVLLSACGGGGGGSDAPASNVIKLSSAIQSEHVADYVGAFGMLAGPGVAAIYTSIVTSFVQGVTSGAASSSTPCSAGGSINVVTQNAGAAGLQAGESATLTFNQCTGEVHAPTVADDAQVNGAVSVQVQTAAGPVGSATQNWSYTAIETASNVTLVSGNGTNTLSGTVTYTQSYDANSGVTTTTATAPTVTVGRTQTTSTGIVNGAITITSLAFSRIHGANPITDMLATSAAVSVSASDAVIAFNVATPTPVLIGQGDLQAGLVQISDADTVETLTPRDSSTINITVTTGGNSATYTESLANITSIAGGQ
jgi:hypothetical protein